MNLMDSIKSSLTDAAMGQLSSLVGAGERETKSAVSAAVPGVLQALSGMASSQSGADKLAQVVGKFDPASLGQLMGKLKSDPQSIQQQGSDLLGSLLGSGALSGLGNALSKFSGLGSGIGQKLLGYLMPLILGAISSRFVGKKVSAEGLTSMFAQEKNSIANAMPKGFSLDGIPGLSSVGSALQSGYNKASDAARSAADSVAGGASGTPKWLLPVLALALIAAAAYFWFRPALPDVTKLTTDLTGNFKSLGDITSAIKDPASATAAIPKLTELAGKLDGMKAVVDKLPADAKAKVTDLVKSDLGKMIRNFSNTLMMPGVPDGLRPAIQTVIDKMAALAGVPASQFALPSAEVTNLGGEISGALGSLTEALSGIKDVGSADAALPKLTEVNNKLEKATAGWDKLPAAGKATIGEFIKTAIGKLKELVAKVVAMPGIGDKLKPITDQLMSKLSTFER